MLYDIKNKLIQSFVNYLAGISKQGDSKVSIGSTVQPVVSLDFIEVCKTVSGKTNSSTVWVPQSGKSILLKGGYICISKEAACAGAEFIKLYCDSLLDFMIFDISAAALVATGNVIYLPFDIKQGLRLKVGDYIQIVFNGALTAGSVSCALWGNEI